MLANIRIFEYKICQGNYIAAPQQLKIVVERVETYQFYIRERFREHIMSLKSLTFLLALGLGFGASAVNAEETTSSKVVAAADETIKTIIDPAKWHDGAGHVEPGITVAFNPMSPTSWTNFVNPKMHTKMHMAFTNPAQYGQFFKPKFYVDMMNPTTWMSWMDPKSYTVFTEADTYKYWLQPGAYKHATEITHYKELINQDAYAKLGADMKDGASELVAKDGEYSLVNKDNLMKIMNPMTYAQLMLTGAKKIIE